MQSDMVPDVWRCEVCYGVGGRARTPHRLTRTQAVTKARKVRARMLQQRQSSASMRVTPRGGAHMCALVVAPEYGRSAYNSLRHAQHNDVVLALALAYTLARARNAGLEVYVCGDSASLVYAARSASVCAVEGDSCLLYFTGYGAVAHAGTRRRQALLLESARHHDGVEAVEVDAFVRCAAPARRHLLVVLDCSFAEALPAQDDADACIWCDRDHEHSHGAACCVEEHAAAHGMALRVKATGHVAVRCVSPVPATPRGAPAVLMAAAGVDGVAVTGRVGGRLCSLYTLSLLSGMARRAWTHMPTYQQWASSAATSMAFYVAPWGPAGNVARYGFRLHGADVDSPLDRVGAHGLRLSPHAPLLAVVEHAGALFAVCMHASPHAIIGDVLRASGDILTPSSYALYCYHRRDRARCVVLDCASDGYGEDFLSVYLNQRCYELCVRRCAPR